MTKKRWRFRVGMLAGMLAMVPAQALAIDRAGPTVMIDSGSVTGVARGGQRHFLGIPFAAPPIGPLRWRPPQPVARRTRPFRADRFGTICAQADRFGLFARPSEQEDCLSLNVFAPAKAGRPRPVMVWIHGGGLTAGSSADYDATALVAQGVVVVSINYRLGLLGYFANPALGTDNASPNYGLLDQIAALRWVGRNITAFGGDPGNVTIFGESAGARSIAALLASPPAAGLFHRAILQSVSYDSTSIAREDAERRGRAAATQAGCPMMDAACLRALDVKTILRLQGTSSATPAHGGPDLPEAPQVAIATGRFHHVPVIAGWNRDEATWQTGIAELRTGRVLSIDDVLEAARMRVGGDTARASAIAKLYMDTYGVPSLAVSAIRTHSAFVCPTLRMLGDLSVFVPTYAYEFADRSAPQFNPEVSFPYGAAHTSELQYLFPGFRGAAGLTYPLSERQARLASAMQRFWSSFARSGVPSAVEERVRWPIYDATIGSVLILDEPTVLLRHRPNVSSYNCAFWDEQI